MSATDTRDAVMAVDNPEETKCFHCGNLCLDGIVNGDEKKFCCAGCKSVYEILKANDLCEFYSFDDRRISPANTENSEYQYLDDPQIRPRLTDFVIGNHCRIRFHLPSIHCASCIWLLENLDRLNQGVKKSRVDFARKEVCIDLDLSNTNLSSIASQLSSLGYAPDISLDHSEEKSGSKTDNSLLLQLAVAGFCFGNIMLFSFPEYLGIGRGDEQLKSIFLWISLAMSLPVMLFSAQPYFKSAFKSFRQKQINIDVPIALGLLTLFLRSGYDIITGLGSGYLDSLAGLVFFLLIGRWFQSATYANLSFERDYKSYFPLVVSRWNESEWKAVLVNQLRAGDRIKVRNSELIPADSWLESDRAQIDYSFVTGESQLVTIAAGEKVLAGGKVSGAPITLFVEKATAQSHLTRLWNNEVFTKGKNRRQTLIDRVAVVFTWFILVLAFLTAVYWYLVNPTMIWTAVTAVLIVACPCALALAAPFTFGGLLREFGRRGLYLKNADVAEQLSGIDTIVFDKTGTVTHGSASVRWNGQAESDELAMIRQLTSASTHPLSTMISNSIKEVEEFDMVDFEEIAGKGIAGVIDNKGILIGSASFVGVRNSGGDTTSQAHVSIDGKYRGFFEISSKIRGGLPELASRLNGKVNALLSGDNDHDKGRMNGIFGKGVALKFNLTPQHKLDYIKGLQQSGKKVLMIGDGLNDSGALKQSDVGVAVTDAGIFTPASDAIMVGNLVPSLDKILELARSGSVILKTGFIISFIYNAVGISFAMTGHLSPLVAAILMPVSSISVVAFSTFAVHWASKKILK